MLFKVNLSVHQCMALFGCFCLLSLFFSYCFSYLKHPTTIGKSLCRRRHHVPKVRAGLILLVVGTAIPPCFFCMHDQQEPNGKEIR